MSAHEETSLVEGQPMASYTQPAEGSEPTNLENKSRLMKPKDIKIRQKILMFILGVWKCPDELAKEGKCKKWILRGLQSLIVIGSSLVSIAILLVYLFCYYGKANHQLIFLSFVTYWVSVISPEIICTIALISNCCSDDLVSNDIISKEVYRRHIFHVEKMLSEFKGKGKIFVFFVTLALITMFVRLAFSVVLGREGCLRVYDWFWTLTDMFNIFFYTLFCYFLYLQRVALEAEGQTCFDNVKEHICDLELCRKQVVFYFQNYKRLRKLLLPSVWIILFCSSCGITAVFTWNYNSVNQSNITAPEPLPLKTGLCSITCDKTSFLVAKEEDRIFLNLTILLRNIITAGFALIVLNGIDLKHVWDTFRERFFTIYSADNKAVLGELIQFMDCMHTESAVDSFGIMFSIAGFLIGILGNGNLR